MTGTTLTARRASGPGVPTPRIPAHYRPGHWLLYLANPSTSTVREAMTVGPLGAIMSPRQGNQLPAGTLFAIDNGCDPGRSGQPGAGYPGDEAYLGMLQRLAGAGMPDLADPDGYRCLFATAPDVLGDAAATLRRSAHMLGWIRYFGFPAALVAQDGLEDLRVPWDDFDVLFLGGSTVWKLGPAARRLAATAHRRGKWLHMGRVNSLRRLRYAASIGCHSCDGTYLTFAPNVNLPRLLGWLGQVHREAGRWTA